MGFMKILAVVFLLLTALFAGCSNVADEEAIAEYDEVIRLDQQDAGAYKNRGDAYFGVDDWLAIRRKLFPGLNR